MSDLARLLSALTRLDVGLRAPRPVRPSGRRVTEKQLDILEALDPTDPVMVTELADALGVTASTMSLNLKRLEDEGLVVRERDPIDRRVRNVRLTAEGDDVSSVRRGFDAVRAAAALDALRPDRRRLTVEVVSRLADAAEAASARDGTYLRGLTGGQQEDHR